jgi:hypothetical protein
VHRRYRCDAACPRIGAHPAVGGVLHIELFDQLVGAAPCIIAAHAAQPAEQHEVLPAGEGYIEGGVLPGEPDACPYLGRLSGDVVSRHKCLTGGGPQQCGQDLDDGRLAGAVMAKQSAN